MYITNTAMIAKIVRPMGTAWRLRFGLRSHSFTLLTAGERVLSLSGSKPRKGCSSSAIPIRLECRLTKRKRLAIRACISRQQTLSKAHWLAWTIHCGQSSFPNIQGISARLSVAPEMLRHRAWWKVSRADVEKSKAKFRIRIFCIR